MGGIEIGLVFLRCGRTSNFFMVVAFISANFTTHETVYIRNLDGDKKATHEAHFCYGPRLDRAVLLSLNYTTYGSDKSNLRIRGYGLCG